MPLTTPIGDHPFKREIIQIVRAYDQSRPRSLQKHLGPSEIGAGCMRQIGYKLAGRDPVNEVADPWFTFVGSSVHHFMALAAAYYNDVVLNRPDNPRFLVEHRVKVASANSGYDTSGHTDLYDVDNQRVVDWKIVGVTTMRKVTGPAGDTDQYRVQGQTYAAGWAQAGYDVKETMIAYLPRSNFLAKMHLSVFPFDPGVAQQAMARVGAIERLLAGGLQPEQMPAADCTIWCPFYRPKLELGHSSCPGHGDVKDD